MSASALQLAYWTTTTRFYFPGRCERLFEQHIDDGEDSRDKEERFRDVLDVDDLPFKKEEEEA